MLPAFIWPACALWSADRLLPLPSLVFGSPVLCGAGFTVWWLVLCAWKLKETSRGVANGHEIRNVSEWLGLLVLLNPPLAFGIFCAACAIILH
jgi:hypothetical protein